MTNTQTTARLYDADTADCLGVATDDQIEASDNAGDTGIFLVDADGDVVSAGSWDAQQPGVRRVYAGRR